MANLQDQLGLWLAVKQTQEMNNNPNYSFNYTNPLTWGTGISAWIAIPDEQVVDLWGGSYTATSWGGGISSRWLAPVQATSSFASAVSSPASTPLWTERMSDISWGIPNKKKNIWETATQVTDTSIVAPIEPPKTDVIQPFNDATKGQDVQFRQSYRQALETPKITKTPTTTSPTGLSWAELQAYNMLTPQEQKTFQALATQWLKAQTDYLAKSKASMEFAKSQEEKRTEMEDNVDAIADMNSQRNVEEATKQVANLKQNIGYLWTGGQPWVSSQKLDAVSNQVTLADRTLKNILESERLSARNRELGQEKNSEIFTRQIKILQDDLDSKVNKTVQSALNEFTSAELAWKLDTIPEIEAFQQQLYAQLDGDLSSIMDTNIEARKFLIERYDKLAESQKSAMQAKEKAEAEALKRKNTLNKEMSQALGYYVNEDGEALTDRVTGQNIVVPPESDVTYDKDSGQMVILTKNRDGTVWVQIKKVWEPKAVTPEWKQDTTTGKFYQTNSPVNPNEQMTQWNYINVPRTWNNVWQDTNNPWNIMWDSEGQRAIATKLWAVWFYSSPNGRTYAVFPDMQSWVNASVQDLQSKLSGWSSWVTPNTTLAQFATGWTSWPNSPINQNAVDKYVSLTGATANTPIKDIPIENLAKAVFKNEWVDISKNAIIPWVWQQSTVWGYSQDDYINRITAMLPAGMKDNKSEMDRVTKMAKSYMEKWMTPQEAVLKFSGYEIQDPSLTDIWMAYVDIGDNLLTLKPKNYESTVSKYINKWDFNGLNTYINWLADDKVKDRYGADSVLSTTYKVGNDRTDTLVSLINTNKDKIGAFDWNVNDFLNKFKSDPQYQKLKTILTMSQADTRKFFAGSAVTENEMNALKDFIGGKTTMTPENLVTILETIKEDRNNTFETQRRGLMPPKTQAVQAKKKLGWFSLTDILSKLN